MIIKRFLSKTNPISITIILGVVVMLLLFLPACGNEKAEIVEVEFDPETTYTLRTTDVFTLISDSGITRYSMEAKEWLMFDKAAEPFWYFPEGVYVEKFDSLFQAEASIKADTAYYYRKKGLWKGIGNVQIESLQGEKFNTELLYWDENEGKIYSDAYIRIEQEDKIITGIGFESNQSMTQYKIFNSQGIFPVSETPRDTSLVYTEEPDSLTNDSLRVEPL